MIKTVVNSFHWSPKKINKLFLDDLDFQGLEYWYNFIDKETKQDTP